MGDIQVNAIPVLHNMVLVWISVIILYFILRHFLYKPVKEFLTKRQDLIDGQLRDAEKEIEEALALREAVEKRLATAREEGATIVDEHRTHGEAVRDQLIEEGKHEAELIKERAEREIEYQKAVAYDAVYAEAGDMAVTLAEKILDEKLKDSEKQREFIEKFIGDMERD